ncbi:PREDICTED: uncharacterized protein LOC106702191 [Paramuricea clavata]|uniref:PREDICTED: uncharacterized protein LOC106702191 n=1 Tax=Paramuricea clavata TaxID=317549 RepID=A0A7D9I2U2_PARCT|nr:PREDICTED: uncharacterized protein LOC106702191 [Paramuricea clavata]
MCVLENQRSDKDLFVGITTRMQLNKCLADGDISDQQAKKFYTAVRQFYIAAAKYMLKNLPLGDETLKNAQFVNWEKRVSGSFEQVAYFAQRYQHIFNFNARQHEILYDEFIDYQMMNDTDLPKQVKEAATLRLDEDDEIDSLRMDVIWGYLGNLKVSGYPRFQHLSKVAQLVLVLPHSNAEEERAFSLVRKNKTCFRGNLDINRTLSAIMTIKMNSTAPCFEYKPTDEVVKNSKKVAWQFNKSHMSKNK